MEILAIIPARGGSKGIPRKNVLPVNGRPLLSYTVRAACHARKVTRVVVSTDDVEIASVAREAGAEIIMRPADISGDSASSESALLHVLSILQERDNYVPDILVFLQCTSPLTIADDIDGTIMELIERDADSALAVVPFHYYVWSEDSTKEATGVNHDKISRPMRQDRENQFLESGAVYVMRTAGFVEKKHRFFGKTVLYKMPEERCFEIDEPVDIIIAEALLKSQQG